MSRGIKARSLGPLDGSWSSTQSAKFGIPFVINFDTTASVLNYDWINDSGRTAKVTRCYGYLVARDGVATDTVVVKRVAGASGSTSGDITDTADLNPFSDKDQFDLSEINDAYNEILPGDTLRVTTAPAAPNAARVSIFIECVWKE